MSNTMRLLLLVVPILVAAYTIYSIRKSHMRSDDSVFWMLFSLSIALCGIFPDIVIWAAELLGVQSPANLVFLVVIAMLAYKLFSLTAKLAVLEAQLRKMVQDKALEDAERAGL